jgi:hypothetical protein
MVHEAGDRWKYTAKIANPGSTAIKLASFTASQGFLIDGTRARAVLGIAGNDWTIAPDSVMVMSERITQQDRPEKEVPDGTGSACRYGTEDFHVTSSSYSAGAQWTCHTVRRVRQHLRESSPASCLDRPMSASKWSLRSSSSGRELNRSGHRENAVNRPKGPSHGRFRRRRYVAMSLA